MSDHDGQVKDIALWDLRPHRLNANVMSAAMLDKLCRQIQRTGRYPPLIVRPMPGQGGTWQVLDGHQRWQALQRLGRTHARCLVWPVDDTEALMLLATLNRLRGEDQPLRRAALLEQLQRRCGQTVAALARSLPETAGQLERLVSLRSRPPVLRRPGRASEPGGPMYFFLTAGQRRRVEAVLEHIGGRREQALMKLVEGYRQAQGVGSEATEDEG